MGQHILSDQNVWTLCLRIKRIVEWLDFRNAFRVVGCCAVIESSSLAEQLEELIRSDENQIGLGLVIKLALPIGEELLVPSIVNLRL